MNNKKRTVITIDFTDDPEFFDMLNSYRKTLGWTWKRFCLLSIGNNIKDNPDLVLKLVDYLDGGR